jgi:N-methylhydantoinase B
MTVVQTKDAALATAGAAVVRFDGRQDGYLPPEVLDVDPSLPLHREVAPAVDPITFEVVRSSLWNINLEHGEAIKRTSGSPVVIWTDDFNQSIQTEDGDPVCFGPTIQWFGGMADLAVKWTLENRSANPGIRDGDIFLQNDPYIGSNHQMDTSLYSPVFWEGRLFAWVYNCCHEADIGGVQPGSFVPQAKDIFWESQPVPPIKLAAGGAIRQDVEDMFVRKSRLPAKAALELRSQVAGINVAKARLLALVERYGPAVVKAVMRRMIANARAAVAARIRPLPDGVWQDVMYFSARLPGDRRLHRLVTTMEKRGETLTFSNAGTDPQFGPTNCAAGAWRAGILTAAVPMLAFDQYFCTGGVLQCLRFDPAPGASTSCTFPAAATGMGISAVVHQSVQVIGKLLATREETRRDLLCVGGPHTLVAYHFQGIGRDGQPFQGSTTATMASGTGAFSFRDGVSQGGTYVAPRSRVPDVETYEQNAPVLFLYRREIPSGGGHGKWRGGAGVEEAVTPDPARPLTASTFGIASVLPLGAGRFGGHYGPAGGILHFRETGVHARLSDGRIPASKEEIRALAGEGRLVEPKEVGVEIGPDDIWFFYGGSGAGYGDPVLRDPTLVARDVRDGTLTRDLAERVYGVVLAADGAAVDQPGTARRRHALRAARVREAGGVPAEDPSHIALPDRAGVLVLGESLGLRRAGGAAEVVCLECGHVLGAADSNYKLGCLRLDTQLAAIDANLFHDPALQVDEPVAYRQFLCPGCGVLFDNELGRPDDPPVWDVRIDVSSLA